MKISNIFFFPFLCKLYPIKMASIHVIIITWFFVIIWTTFAALHTIWAIIKHPIICLTRKTRNGEYTLVCFIYYLYVQGHVLKLLCMDSASIKCCFGTETTFLTFHSCSSSRDPPKQDVWHSRIHDC